VAVFYLANPRPLLFPIRLGMRLVADTPVVNALANRFFKRGPLPYRPMKIGWYKRILQQYGTVELLSGGIPSTRFSQDVSENSYPGRLAWQVIRFLEARTPRLSARLGNYFLLVLRKT
jgi:hypothetical protein